MDESSSSMRTTWGMPLHVNFVDKLPSFSMGLTQDFGVYPNKFKMNNQWKNWDPRRRKNNGSSKSYSITSGIKIVEKETKRKAINSDSEESESEIDGFEEH